MRELAELHFVDFQPHLHTTFQVVFDDGHFDLELVEADELPDAPNQERFSLMFHGSPEFFLPQATYMFSHPQMGDFPLFLVPMRKSAEGYLYQAVFNRLRSSPSN